MRLDRNDPVRSLVTLGCVAAAAALVPEAGATGNNHSHAHGATPVSLVEPLHGQPAPQVSLALRRIGNAWRAILTVTDFRFSRARGDGAHVSGEGHAHLYVNGRKVDQLFEPEVMLPDLSPGVHVITVTLNANDHRFYADRGVPVTASRTLEIGDSSPRRRRPHAILAPLLDGVWTGAEPIRFVEGDKAAVVVQSNEAMVLHLHGYDVEIAAAPGEPAAIAFDAHTAGRFPVERHGGDGHKALFYVEIHPN